MIVGGAGLPFGLLGMAGAQFAPVSHMGALLPGSMPVFVALLSVLVLGERFSKLGMIGLGVIVVGVICVVAATLSGSVGGPSVLFGDTLFIVAGVFWAVYTVAYRKSGLDPWHGAALVCFWSAVLITPLWAIMPKATLLSAPFPDLVLQVVAQGVLTSMRVRRFCSSLAVRSNALTERWSAEPEISRFLISSALESKETVVGISLTASQ